MRQFDVVRIKGGQLVVLLQSGLLEHLSTRLVVPLLPTSVLQPVPRLHPSIRVEGNDYAMMMELMSPIRAADIVGIVSSALDLEYEIKRAYDMVLGGA